MSERRLCVAVASESGRPAEAVEPQPGRVSGAEDAAGPAGRKGEEDKCRPRLPQVCGRRVSHLHVITFTRQLAASSETGYVMMLWRSAVRRLLNRLLFISLRGRANNPPSSMDALTYLPASGLQVNCSLQYRYCTESV